MPQLTQPPGLSPVLPPGSIKPSEASPPRSTPFRARLTEAGLAVEDTALLCREYAKTTDWPTVRRQALQENLLGKGSQARTQKLLRTVQKRVIEAQPPLSHPLALARFLASRFSDAAKAQLLFVLAVAEDVALAEGFRRVVIPVLTSASRRAPTTDDLVDFLARQAETRPEVAAWGVPTRRRWAEGFRLVLRELGILTGKPGQETLIPLTPRDEAVCFLCHAVADAGISGWPILREPSLRCLLLTDSDAVRAARSLQDRGWWNFAQSGDLVEFTRKLPSLEDCVRDALAP